MDTMTLTKAASGVLAAWLILLVGKWVATEMYSVGGHGKYAAAYVIEVEDAGGAAEEDTGPSILEVIASADLEKGAKVYKKCQSCHKLEDGANGTGPYLYGVVGRQIGTANGFGYSGVLSGMTDTAWSVEELDAFLLKPKDYAPGTTMGFAGLKKIEDRANVIAYLDSLDD